MIVFHFDVISSEDPVLDKRHPSAEGRMLWRTFFEAHKGRMVITADVGTDQAQLSDWLKREGFKATFIQIADSFSRSDSTARADAVWALSVKLGKVQWYVDSDPDTCSRTLKWGIPTLLVAIPSFQRPEWHTDSGIRAWDSVVEELDDQALKKAELTWRDEV